VHFFWLTDGELSAELGIDVPYLCGRWGGPPKVRTAIVKVRADDGVPVEEPDDCPECLAVLEVSRLLGRKAA
jgi:hypothetical protein